MTIIMRCDGSSRPTNPGPSGAGVAFFTVDGEFIKGQAWPLGWFSNNESEYRALILGLELAQEQGYLDLAVQADSKLVIEQMKGNWNCNKPHLLELRDQALELTEGFNSIDFEWIPRALNTTADEFAGLAALEAGLLQ